MKKQLNKKLLLNKTTVVSLEGKEMKDMKGGYISAGGTCLDTDCNTYCTYPEYCKVNPTRTCLC